MITRRHGGAGKGNPRVGIIATRLGSSMRLLRCLLSVAGMLMLLSGVVAARPGTSALAVASAARSQAATSGNDTVAVHPDRLTPLTPDGSFPRFTAEQLRRSGYPDHLHAFGWNDWTVLRDGDDLAYGPGSLCLNLELVPQPDLKVEPGWIQYRHFTLDFNEQYRPCDLLLFIELCELGRAWCRDLLNLVAQDTLHIINPDNTQAYHSLTGLGTWRLYALAGDTCRVQPIPVLVARTLIGHAAVSLVTRWTLQDRIGTDLPPWLEHGLASYLADEGVHLNNYMAQFRPLGPVLMSPAEVDSILAAPPHPDLETDRRLFRQANYNAFLMVWHLVENNGGLAPLRALLADLATGEALHTVCRKHYHVGLDELEARLDPLACGEPIGEAVEPRRPHQPPQP